MPVTATTHTSEYLAVLRGCLADPGDDTGWLALADFLDERAETVQVVCPNGCWPLYGKHVVSEDGRKYGTSPAKVCPECSGTGTVARSEMADRAELVRLDVELARCPICEGRGEIVGGTNPARGEVGHRVAEKTYRCWACGDLRARQSALLEKHPDWSAWPCPGPGDSHAPLPYTDTCHLCGGSRDLLREPSRDTVMIRRGEPHPTVPLPVVWAPGRVAVLRVTVPTMTELVALETLGSGRVRVGMGYRPTPRLLTLASTSTPWGVPVAEVVPADRVPYHSPLETRTARPHPKGKYSGIWFDADTANAASHLPTPVFRLLEGGYLRNPNCREFDTPDAAVSALGRAVAAFGRPQ